MAFAESLKSDIRRLADMRCCLCQAIGVEIHHIISEAEGGSDESDNAAPLCPSCHETYGANPTKRKLIREARDHWFALCEQRRGLYPAGLIAQLVAKLEAGITKDDLAAAKADILSAIPQKAAVGFVLDDGPGENLARILAWLFDTGGPTSPVSVEDRDFLYFFVWGGDLRDSEYEDTKKDFIRTFGEEAARRACRNVLRDHPYSLIKDGLTEPEIGKLVFQLFVLMVLMLNHHEIAWGVSAMELRITDGGDLHARARNRQLSLKLPPPP